MVAAFNVHSGMILLLIERNADLNIITQVPGNYSYIRSLFSVIN